MKKLVGLIAVLAMVVGACADGSTDATPAGTEVPNSDTSATETVPAAPNDATVDPSDPEDEDGTTSTTVPGSDGTQPEPPPAQGAPPTDDPPPPTGSDTPLFEQGNIDPGLAPFIEMAIADLAKRMGVATNAIAVHSAVLVVWPDSSLGCPRPDMVYKQVPEDGSLIELTFDGSIFSYHTGGNQTTPFYCDQPLKEAPPTGDINV